MNYLFEEKNDIIHKSEGQEIRRRSNMDKYRVAPQNIILDQTFDKNNIMVFDI